MAFRRHIFLGRFCCQPLPRVAQIASCEGQGIGINKIARKLGFGESVEQRRML